MESSQRSWRHLPSLVGKELSYCISHTCTCTVQCICMPPPQAQGDIDIHPPVLKRCSPDAPQFLGAYSKRSWAFIRENQYIHGPDYYWRALTVPTSFEAMLSCLLRRATQRGLLPCWSATLRSTPISHSRSATCSSWCRIARTRRVSSCGVLGGRSGREGGGA